MMPVEREYDAFATVADRVLAVSRDELKRRLTKYKKKADKNPKKRGPKTGKRKAH